MKILNIKNIIFTIIIIILFLPIVQYKFEIFNIKKLNGYFWVIYRNPELRAKDWFEGNYQTNYENFINDSIGFKPIFTKAHNQILYSLFSSTNENNFTFGKNKTLYQTNFINSYLGKDFVGSNSMRLKIKKLEFIKNQLEKYNTKLLVVLAPGKARIYPEYLPEEFENINTDSTNYNIFIKEISKSNIDYIDFAGYLSKYKKKFKYPLYPKGGTHWSGYCTSVVADSMFNYMRLKFNFNLRKYKTTGGYETNSNFVYTDDDLSQLLNVFWVSDNWSMYYPNVRFLDNKKIFKPNSLLICDSYGQSFYHFYPYFDSICSNKSSNWGYYKYNIWPTEKIISRKDIYNDLTKRDIIILLASEINYIDISFGFIDDAYAIFHYDSLEYKKAINDIFTSIKNTPDWYKSIEEQAKNNGIPLEENMYNNAIYMLKEKYLKQ